MFIRSLAVAALVAATLSFPAAASAEESLSTDSVRDPKPGRACSARDVGVPFTTADGTVLECVQAGDHHYEWTDVTPEPEPSPSPSVTPSDEPDPSPSVTPSDDPNPDPSPTVTPSGEPSGDPSASPSPSAPPSGDPTDDPTYPGHYDYDCEDFSSQAAAQAVYNADTSDPFDLDRDGDGIACEWNPGRNGYVVPVSDKDYWYYLPTTGAALFGLVAAGVVAVGGGGLAMYLSRRRRTEAETEGTGETTVD